MNPYTTGELFSLFFFFLGGGVVAGVGKEDVVIVDLINLVFS